MPETIESEFDTNIHKILEKFEAEGLQVTERDRRIVVSAFHAGCVMALEQVFPGGKDLPNAIVRAHLMMEQLMADAVRRASPIR